MIRAIPFASLGRFDLDWLESRFHFNFSGIAAPMGGRFGPLRVWNDDLIRPQTGFDFHGHRDMEIITYVRQGAITHRDHLGNEGRIQAGDVQVMHAGRGIMHGEWNEETDDTLLYQIWVEPNKVGADPGWAEARFHDGAAKSGWRALASGEQGIVGALPIHQDATLYAARLGAGESLAFDLRPNRRAYIVLAAGAASLNGQALSERDGAAVEGESKLKFAAMDASDILLFDLP